MLLHRENKTPQQNYNLPILMMYNVREKTEDFGCKTGLNCDRQCVNAITCPCTDAGLKSKGRGSCSSMFNKERAYIEASESSSGLCVKENDYKAWLRDNMFSETTRHL